MPQSSLWATTFASPQEIRYVSVPNLLEHTEAMSAIRRHDQRQVPRKPSGAIAAWLIFPT
jgi:hypothetical protein